MQAKEKPLSFIKGQTIYKIPFFQRGYVWDENNWQDLWDELISKKQDCFLGSIILKEDSESSRDDVTYKIIIDGQQRFTTLSILLRSLSDYYTASSESNDVEDDIEEYLFYVKTERGPEGKKKIRTHKLIASQIDNKNYEKIIDGYYKDNWNTLKIDEEDKNNTNSKLIKCYCFFRKCLENASSEKIDHIVSKLTYDTSKILVVIDLSSNENEQAIFDTINSAGVKLTNADIIKNALYQSIVYNNDGKIRDDIVNFYNETWLKYFEKDEETLNEWLSEKVVGRVTRTNIDRF